jgi:transcriptional regulator
VAYVPDHFKEPNQQLVHEIIRSYNFAALITVLDGLPVIGHFPLLFEPGGASGDGMVFGHMARANPQWRSFKAGVVTATVIFQGPHAYISPRWYQPAPDNVPTWNYAVVHVQGIPRIIGEAAAAYAVMQQLVQRHDPEWPLALSEQDRRELQREIVVFEIAVTKIEAKFKLSQNRSVEDADNVARLLSEQSDQVQRETGDLMQRLRQSKGAPEP